MRTCQLRGHVRRAVRCDDRQATHLHSIRELEFGASGAAWRADRGHRRPKSLTMHSHVSVSDFRGPGRRAKA
jgi:hypothetical protein